MDSKDSSRICEVLLVTLEGLLDVNLFKFVDGFLQEDSSVKHLFHQGFELSAQCISSLSSYCLYRSPPENGGK